MHTARLPTIGDLVATTRCQYWWGTYTLSPKPIHYPSGPIPYPSQTYTLIPSGPIPTPSGPIPYPPQTYTLRPSGPIPYPSQTYTLLPSGPIPTPLWIYTLPPGPIPYPLADRQTSVKTLLCGR